MAFTYTQEQLQQVERLISAERLEPYLKFSSKDKGRALKLYEANAVLSEAMYTPLQSLEIALRNSMNITLSVGLKRADWYNLSVWNTHETEQIAKARSRLREELKGETSPRMVAMLSFGFWVGLMKKGYARSLWTPCLYKAFPEKNMLHKDAHDRFQSFLTLRNRIAHHEPLIFRHKDLQAELNSIVEAAGWINLDLANWIRLRSTPRLRAAYDEARQLAGQLP